MAILLQAVEGLSPDQLAEDATERRQTVAKLMEEAPTRLAAELARLRALGVIDEQGHRLATTLPPDMIPGAARDFGG